MKCFNIFILVFFYVSKCLSQTQTNQDIAFDLIHTTLKLTPDFESHTLNGQASLILKPYFYKQNNIKIDAKEFIIKGISINKVKTNYTYNGSVILIEFDKFYYKTDTLVIDIAYTAQPDLIKSRQSESITNDKGLYFITTSKNQKQLWTQGETQANSCWFPTIDNPNQKHTQDIYLTVPKQFTTLSNGLLVKSLVITDTTKTDHWVQTLPHSVYLTMIAAGDFVKVIDKDFKDFEVSYYLEPEYESSAKGIFGRTPEMIRFFEKLIGVNYKWEKYAQLPVRKFVSGAMENTTATIHGKTLLKTNRQLLDGNDDGVIAHELFHHWFGNLVTCESWSHLPLNESFANYSEFLWATHKYGKAEGDFVYYNALKDYLDESNLKQVPLIRFDYLSNEDMFDAHSYQKGGRVLHQLRLEVGDEAFFLTLKNYLNQHSFSNVEIEDLRLAFEKTTGKNLKWFFDQWFMKTGHPRLTATHKIENENIIISIKQQLDSVNRHCYRLNLPINIHTNDAIIKLILVVDKKDSVFTLALPKDYKALVINSEGYFLGTINHITSLDEEILKFKLSTDVVAKISAFEQIISTVKADNEIKKEPIHDPKIREFVLLALKDSFWRIRQMAVQAFFNYDGGDFLEVEKALQQIIKYEQNSLVRSEAILAIKNYLNPQNDILFRAALNDSSYLVVAAALEALFSNNVEDADSLAKKFRNETDANMFAAIGNYYSTKFDANNYDWFVARILSMESYELYQYLNIFGSYLYASNSETQNKAVPLLIDIAKNQNEWYGRVTATQILSLLAEDNSLAKTGLQQIITAETHPKLIMYYQQFKK